MAVVGWSLQGLCHPLQPPTYATWRLLAPRPPRHCRRYSIERAMYNAVLTGAAFIDTWTAFPAYWADAVRPARETGTPCARCSVAVAGNLQHSALALLHPRCPLHPSVPSHAPLPPLLPHMYRRLGAHAVDRVFNGEDLLMNFVLANASAAAAAAGDAYSAVEFMRPTVRGGGVPGCGCCGDGDGGGLGGSGAGARRASYSIQSWSLPAPASCPQRRVDISKLSGVGISHNWGGFLTAATDYLANFTATFGGVPLVEHNFNWGHFRCVCVCEGKGSLVAEGKQNRMRRLPTTGTLLPTSHTPLTIALQPSLLLHRILGLHLPLTVPL